MGVMEYIILILVLIPVAYFADKVIKGITAGEGRDKDWAKELAEREVPQIPPALMQSLKDFGVSNAMELRGKSASDLVLILPTVAKALKIFEDRIEDINKARDNIESRINFRNSLDAPLFKGRARKRHEEDFSPQMQGLNEHERKVIEAFERDLEDKDTALWAIPENYRHSIILEMMRRYLETGEVDSWEGCIKAFKEDAHRMQQNEQLEAFGASLERIRKNTAAAAFFAGVTAWNTR